MARDRQTQLTVALAEVARYEHKVSVSEGILLDRDVPDDQQQRTLTELRTSKKLRGDWSDRTEGLKTQVALANKEVEAFAAGMIESSRIRV